MKRELGKGGMVFAVVIAVVAIGAVAYFGFFKSAGYSAEEQTMNDRMVRVSDERFKQVTEGMDQPNVRQQSPRDGRGGGR